MGLDQAIDITTEQSKIVLGLLERHLPNTTAWVYGSRAKWTSRPQSDLDVVVFATPKQNGRVSDLRQAFEESNLPFRVDLFVWDAVPEQFRGHIKQDHVVLIEREERSVTGEWSRNSFDQILIESVRNGVYKKKEFHGRGVKIVNMGELFAHSRLRAVPMRRVEISESEAERFLIAKGDLLFARRSLVAEGAGKCCAVLEVDEPTTFESSIIRARPDKTKADFLYLYYFFNSLSGLHQLDTIRRQVAVAGITGGDLANLEIPVPPLPEQRAIAHILGTLDDKIELNRRMNETLEAMARALFKSWFVDFDPVRAKMEGRDHGLPKHIADLFPDRFVDSELGEIPEGWAVKALGDLFELAYGKALKANSRHRGNVPVYGSNGKVGWHDKKLVQGPGIVVGRKGNPGVVTWVATDFFPIDTTFYVVPKDSNLNLYFLFYALKGQDLPSIAADSVVPGLNRHLACMNKQVMPAGQIVEHFDGYIGPIFDRSYRLEAESHTLAALRDALLPKLISGELRVKDAGMFFAGPS